ncbi:MAG: hypothetical protein KC462_06815, partial [Cyanobacteria bacterium HKST-UBA05]|nr:hypothetical protein [Cyanobacteria bacterium HKST-UBA05]
VSNGTVEVSYNDAFRVWVKAWNKTRLDHNRVGFMQLLARPQQAHKFFARRNRVLAEFNELESAFKHMVYLYNMNHQPFTANPDELSRLTVKGLKGPGVVSKAAPDDVLRNLQRFPGFMEDVLKQSRSGTGYSLEKVLKVAEQLERSLVKSKAVSSVLATFACFCAVGSVSWIAQHNRSYPANRNMTFEALVTGKAAISRTSAAAAPSHRNTQVNFGNQKANPAGQVSMQLKQLPRIHIRPQLKQLPRIHILSHQPVPVPVPVPVFMGANHPNAFLMPGSNQSAPLSQGVSSFKRAQHYQTTFLSGGRL